MIEFILFNAFVWVGIPLMARIIGAAWLIHKYGWFGEKVRQIDSPPGCVN